MIEHQPFQWANQRHGFEQLPKHDKLPFAYKHPPKFKDTKTQLFFSSTSTD